MFDECQCRICGCTDDNCYGCFERTGEPCYWVEADLCSACAVQGDVGGYSRLLSGLYVPSGSG